MQVSRRMFLSTMVLASLAITDAHAAENQATTVYVKDMHCQSCAKKIAGKLYGVPGVVKVSTDVKKGIALITPQASKHPSPKATWEAVEAAGFQPVKLASPLGVFTQKPLR